jgi:hypothetical protein
MDARGGRGLFAGVAVGHLDSFRYLFGCCCCGLEHGLRRPAAAPVCAGRPPRSDWDRRCSRPGRARAPCQGMPAGQGGSVRRTGCPAGVESGGGHLPEIGVSGAEISACGPGHLDVAGRVAPSRHRSAARVCLEVRRRQGGGSRCASRRLGGWPARHDRVPVRRRTAGCIGLAGALDRHWFMTGSLRRGSWT